MEWLHSLIVLLGAYLIGSIPFSYFFSSSKNKHAKQNSLPSSVTSTTTQKLFFKWFKRLLLSSLNFIKGLTSVYLVLKLFPGDFYLLLSASGGVLLGEVFPCWVRIKGTKGLDVAAGSLILINPIILLLWSGLFLIFYLAIRRDTIAALIATFGLPLIVFFVRHIYFTDKVLLIILPISMLIFQRYLEDVPKLIRQKSLKIKNGDL